MMMGVGVRIAGSTCNHLPWRHSVAGADRGGICHAGTAKLVLTAGRWGHFNTQITRLRLRYAPDQLHIMLLSHITQGDFVGLSSSKSVAHHG